MLPVRSRPWSAISQTPCCSTSISGDDDGFALCDAVTRLRLELAVILTSAENYEHLPERSGSCGARGFIRKEQLSRVDFARFWQPA